MRIKAAGAKRETYDVAIYNYFYSKRRRAYFQTVQSLGAKPRRFFSSKKKMQCDATGQRFWLTPRGDQSILRNGGERLSAGGDVAEAIHRRVRRMNAISENKLNINVFRGSKEFCLAFIKWR